MENTLSKPLDPTPYLGRSLSRYSAEEWIGLGNALSVSFKPRLGYEQDESKYL